MSLKAAVALALIIAVALGGGYFLVGDQILGMIFPPSTPPELEFNVTMPSHVKAMETVEVRLSVSNVGGSRAENVTLKVESQAFTLENHSFSVAPGETKHEAFKLKVGDVKDGVYKVSFRLKYSSGGKDFYTKGVEREVRVLPAVKLVNVGWKFDFFNPLGKSAICRGDATTLHFQVKSLSENVIYEGLKAEVKVKIAPKGLTVSPSTVEVEMLGPKGVSPEYVITISAAADVPPGEYPIEILLYTADGILVEAENVKLTVKP